MSVAGWRLNRQIDEILREQKLKEKHKNKKKKLSKEEFVSKMKMLREVTDGQKDLFGNE